MKRIALIILCSLAMLVLAPGCSTTVGDTYPSTHFTFPNSNVKPMGTVSAQKTKGSVFIPRVFKSKDLVEVMNDALAQKPGSDILINVKADTVLTQIPIPILTIYFTKWRIEGTAAKMEVGEKDLRDTMEEIKYQ